jgi:hypothetical protein
MATHFIAPKCHRCGGANVKLRRQIITSGAVQIGWHCVNCGRWAEPSPHWMKHEDVAAWLRRFSKAIDDIPVANDYSGDHLCVICGAPAEYNHWWPQALADECEDWTKWPGDYLCVKHHREWHDHITPYLVNGRKDKAA